MVFRLATVHGRWRHLSAQRLYRVALLELVYQVAHVLLAVGLDEAQEGTDEYVDGEEDAQGDGEVQIDIGLVEAR